MLPGDDGPHSQTTDKRSRAWPLRTAIDALHLVAISNAGDDQSALLNQLRERALASVDDPNTTLAIFEWRAEDCCAVDDWDAIAQGTPGLGYTVSHEAILSSLAMDPPRCSGPR